MMAAARVRLEALAQPDPATGQLPPLTSQEIGGAIHELALDMLAETEGWAQLFNVKDVEAA